MAGGVSGITPNYNDIDSGKMLNKTGLLELSGQIKGYIDTNIPSTILTSQVDTGKVDQTTNDPIYLDDYLDDLETAISNATTYTLPVASTSTLGGVKVDGSTITIDQNGVISSSGGGGSSYTAGDGIDITNDVISSTVKGFDKRYHSPWFLLFGGLPFTAGLTTSPAQTKEEALEILSMGGSVYKGGYSGSLSLTDAELYQAGFIYKYTKNTEGNFVRSSIFATGSSLTTIYAAGNNFYAIGEALVIGRRDEVKNFLLKNLEYDNTTSGLTATTIKGAIDELAVRPIASIPADPTTDGTYILLSTVSSGTATQSWENVIIGGSY